MIYLSGSWNAEIVAASDRRVGMMSGPHIGYRVPDGLVWAADNGCFSRGTSFDLSAFLLWLRRQDPTNCLFAVAPDVVGDAEATWARSKGVLPEIRSLGFRAALVAQDGWDQCPVEWDAFDVVFLGGTTRWKLQASQDVASCASQHGKRLHMGRVNSCRRLMHAAQLGCASVDGTFLAFGPKKNVPKLLRWLDALDRQPVLDLARPR